MKRPAVFFDRDNTLIISDGYLGDSAKVQLIPGAAEAIARARRLGYAVVSISNQSGVARGMFDESDVQAVNARMDQLLQAEEPAAIIDRHEFCPFHPQAAVAKYRKDSDLRKPKPGMILQAAQQLDLDLSRSWMVGDVSRDIDAGAAAGCRTILFTDPSLPASPAAAEPGRVKPEFSVTSLKGALDVIEKNPPKVEQKPVEKTHLDTVAEQILLEMRRRNETAHSDFSVTKLLAGMTQIMTLAAMFLAYLNRSELPTLQTILMIAILLQCLTIALLIMARQK